MNPGIAIVVWAALRATVQKTTEFFTPGPTAEQREQSQQHIAAMRYLKDEVKLERRRREAKLAEERQKGLLLPLEQAEALYQQGMIHWHRGEKQQAAKLISRAARNGNENARVMTNMHDLTY